MPVESVPHLFDLLITADQLLVANHTHGRFEHELIKLVFLLRRKTVDIGEMFAAGDETQSVIVLIQTLRQRLKSVIFQLPGLARSIGWRILQGLNSIQDEQRSVPTNQPGQSLTTLPRCSFGRIRVAEECEGGIDEQVRLCLLSLPGSLRAETPVEVTFDARPAFGNHPRRQPLRDQSCLPHSSPGDKTQNVSSGIFPGW